MCVGFMLLPKIIWMMYQMMYEISDVVLDFNWYYGLTGLILISICIIGATIYASYKELNQTPATLMRPKAPKKGKRVKNNFQTNNTLKLVRFLVLHAV